MKNEVSTFTLANGVEIPCLGFGTWLMEDGPETEDSVLQALNLGYRHIDTAYFYKNEVSVGRAIEKSSLKREEIFVTSKLWNTDRGYEQALAAFEKTMENLGLDYLDLYLIHWPAIAKQFENWQEINRDTWKALVKLYREGRVRAIGVSNFMPRHLQPLLESEVTPMVNQIEFHPGWQQQETLTLCRAHGVLVEAWSPLGRGRVLSHPLLQELGQTHGKSTAQICLRWCLQMGVLPLPKSVTPSRIQENLQVFDFTLSPEEMAAIAALAPFGQSGKNPDEIDF